MKILVVGSGGREHALELALSSAGHEVHVAPGNAGIDPERVHDVSATASQAIVHLAKGLGSDLVVIGPEAALVAGVADACRAAGLVCFGPSKAAAELEASKAFAKDVMAAAGVPTAAFRVCTEAGEAAAALDEFGPPYVVKDDGLAAGKGVLVTTDRTAALGHAAACERVVIEEYLDGPEVSLFCVTDGTTIVPLLPAQDYKRVGDGDTGPNTGGMGAYCPLPWLPEDFVDEVVRTVAAPTIAEMANRGRPFAGLLYCGLAVTSKGIRVVEFNARFGDPETQAIVPLLASDLGTLLYAAATGTLAEQPAPVWRPGACVTVVLAAQGYPGRPVTGTTITGLQDAASIHGVHIVHAGTERDDAGRIITSGGRVLAITAADRSLPDARERAYAAIRRIGLPGSHYRHDIADLP